MSDSSPSTAELLAGKSTVRDRHPGSTTEARRIVETLAQHQVETYRRQRRELVSHFNRERSAVEGYRGRQLLELLQNADDAGTGQDDARLLIDLVGDRLVVANTGTPFSERGLESLVISDCSPKQLDRNRFIGCKGLGFRSVLTWTDRPLISSGALRVLFDIDRALATVRSLAADDPALGGTIQEVIDAEGRPPVAIMRFPFVPDERDADLRFAGTYHSRGYTTVIVLPLRGSPNGDGPLQEAATQMQSLPTESLLFCQHLTEVTLNGPVTRRWQILRQHLGPESMRLVIDAEGANSMWTVYSRQGALTAEAGIAEPASKREYQTAIAVPDHPEPVETRALCVFFPTQDTLPLPVVLHATLELGDDRNRVHDNRKNRRVLAALAAHFADIVEEEADETNPQRALRLLQGLERADGELVRLGFVQAAVEALRSKPVFPRLDGTLGLAEHSYRMPNDAWRAILRVEHFADVLDVRSDDGLAELLKLFDIGWFGPEELLRRLQSQATDMEPFALGEMVGRLVASDRLGSFHVHSLILDDSGQLRTEESPCFFTPASPLPPLPEWARDIRFLHGEFQRGLQEGSKTTTLRSLSGLLERRDSKVEEYRLDTVARALVQRVHAVSPEDRPLRVRALLSWLYSACDGAPPASIQVSIPVLDDSGKLRRPEECYFSTSFPMGDLVSRLYARINDVVFVAPPENLGLGGKPMAKVEAFLRLLGVSGVPRAKPLPYQAATKFAEHVLESLGYPVTVRDHHCRSCAEAKSLCREYSVQNLRVPERWLQLLERADPTTLVAYLLTAGAQFLATDFDQQAYFAARVHNERQEWPDHSIPIPNPVLHCLRTTAWVPCEDGQKHAPSEVILSPVGSRVLQGLYFRPTLRTEDPAIQAAGGRKAISGLLTRLGAIASLDAIDPEALYDLLLRLPVQDPDGKHAPGIYRTLIESSVQGEEGPARHRFIQSGRIWSKHDDVEQYLPVASVRYNANVTIPPMVERYLKLADLPRRKSTRHVQQLFGVQPLSPADVRIEIVPDATEYDPSSEDANAHFREAVPFIYALRLARKLDEDGKERNQLARAQLRLCTRVRVNASLPGEDVRSIDLSTRGDSILVKDSLYVIGEYDRTAATLVRFWQGVANLVAELLGTDVAAEVANVLRCRNIAEMEDVVLGLLPDEGYDVLAEARARFLQVDAPEYEPEHAVPPQAPPGEPANAVRRAPSGPTQEPTGPNDAPPSPESPRPKSFEPIQGPEHRPTRKRRLVIAPSFHTSTGRGRGPIATEDVTFRVAEAYEELADPPRFPIRVSHIRGTEAFGCDMLSLRTMEARDRAREQGLVADSDILRFIEVKGRSSRTGQVELSDNEFDKARAERDRYFLYRVFRDPADQDRYELAILQDPVQSKAIRTMTRFDLAEGSGAAWFAMETVVEQEATVPRPC